MKTTIALLTLFFIFTPGLSQGVNEDLIKNLLKNSSKEQMAGNDEQMLNIYVTATPEEKFKLLDILKRFSTSADLHLSARSLSWEGVMLARPPFSNPAEASTIFQQALTMAVQSGDKYLMVQVFENYAAHCRSFGNPEVALFYYLKSAELRKELNDDYLGIKNNQHFGTVGDQLYQMQEYDMAIGFLKQAMNIPSKKPLKNTTWLNTIGLSYQRSGKFDSAFYWYEQSLQNAEAQNDTIWEAIVTGNIGALYFEQGNYEKALPLLWKDYYTTVETEPNNAGHTLHRIALIYLRTGKTDSAMILARKSYQAVSAYIYPNKQFIRNASAAFSEVFRKTGNIDSAFYYSDISHRLNDTLNLYATRNRAEGVQTKLEFEKTVANIKLLQQEKAAEKSRRQLLTAGILILLAAGWFYFRWQKQQSKNRQQELLYQKQLAEAEVSNARQQLEEYTQHFISKNELIEKLQLQLQEQNLATNEELLNQTILTENDWLRFKDMFEKANPGFIPQLKKLVPDITPAELRLATLIRLNVGNKHIASMLGTSADAVRKTKSRLRQRLQITVEDGLEDYIRSINS